MVKPVSALHTANAAASWNYVIRQGTCSQYILHLVLGALTVVLNFWLMHFIPEICFKDYNLFLMLYNSADTSELDKYPYQN